MRGVMVVRCAVAVGGTVVVRCAAALHGAPASGSSAAAGDTAARLHNAAPWG